MSLGIGYTLVLFAASLTNRHPPLNVITIVPETLTLYARSSLLFPQRGSAAVYNFFDIMVNRPRFNGAGADGWWIIRASG